MTPLTPTEQALAALREVMSAALAQLDAIVARERAEAEGRSRVLDMSQTQVLRLSEAAGVLGMSASKADRLASAGEFPVPVHQIGRGRVVSRVQLEAYLAGEGARRAS